MVGVPHRPPDMKRLNILIPSRKYIEPISIKDIHRAVASKIYKIRSGHAPLNAFLHKFKIKKAHIVQPEEYQEKHHNTILKSLAYTHQKYGNCGRGREGQK